MPPHHRHGIAWMILACFLAACMMNVVRYVGLQLPTIQVMGLRNIITMIMVIIIIQLFTTKEHRRTTRIKTYIWRSIVGMTAMALWFHSVIVNPINVATALSFTSPIFTLFFAVLFMGESMSKARMLAFFLGFVGTVIILRPGAEVFQPEAIFPITAAVLWAFSSIFIKSLARTDRPIVVVYYMAIIMGAFSIPFTVWAWQPVPEKLWPWIFAMGCLATAFQYVLTRAFATAPFSTVLPYDFTRLIFTALIAYWLFGEVLDYYTTLGAGIIMISAVFGNWQQRKEERRAQAKAPTPIQ